MAYNTVSVTAAATQIVAANSKRRSLYIVNKGDKTIYLGGDASVLSTTGIPLLLNGVLSEDDSGTRMYMGPVYGVCAAGESSDCRYWEREL